jgi:hypothetical protein
MYLIKSPSSLQVYLRQNPICNNPVVTIQNTGATTLTSVTITYGLIGGTPSVYQWSGNLNIGETEDVQLENFSWNSSNLTFYATVSNPNGGTDEYAQNNTMYSTFSLPPEYDNQLIFEIKTNNVPGENYYDIFDDHGNVILHKGSLTANTDYNDTVTFATGCYSLHLFDGGEDGLSFWANPGQGSGFFRIKKASTGATLLYPNPDFGGEFYHQFTVGYLLNIDPSVSKNDVTLYPNPSNGKFNIDFSFDRFSDADVTVYDVTGRIVYSKNFIAVRNKTIEIDFSSMPEGVYYATVRTDFQQWNKRIMISH